MAIVAIYALRGPFDQRARHGSAYYVVDTEADLPAVGLNPGDIGFTLDTAAWYGTADGATWTLITAGGAAPTGPAGGVLAGTYPDPDFAVDMATQAELNAAVAAAVAALVGTAPGVLDTLGELSDALGDDANFATTTAASLAAKIAKSVLDANTLLKADADDTPIPLTVAEQRLVGRITGGVITDLTVAQAKTLLGFITQADADARYSQIGHGSADHTDSLGRMFIDKNRMNADGGTSSNNGTAPDRFNFFALADATTQGVEAWAILPPDAKAASPVNIYLHWAPNITENATKVRWSADVLGVTPGAATSLASAGTTTAFDGTAANKTANAPIREAQQVVLASQSAGDLLRIDVRRLGSDSGDTFTGTVRLYGIEVEYTSVQAVAA